MKEYKSQLITSVKCPHCKPLEVFNPERQITEYKYVDNNMEACEYCNGKGYLNKI